MPVTDPDMHADGNSGQPEVISVFIVDDHPAIRAAVSFLLEEEEGVELCGETDTIDDARALVCILHPTVVVVDLWLNGQNGMDLVREFTKTYPNMPVIVFSRYDMRTVVVSALKAGASAFVSKAEPMGNLVAVIRAVASGETLINPRIGAVNVQEVLPGRNTGTIPVIGDQRALC